MMKNARPWAPWWMGVAFLTALACSVAWVKGRTYWQAREGCCIPRAGTVCCPNTGVRQERAWPGLPPCVGYGGVP
jgi:hypothetical protein